MTSLSIKRICAMVTPDTYKKLEAVCRIRGHEMETVSGILLDEAVENAWEDLRSNPKYKEVFEEVEIS